MNGYKCFYRGKVLEIYAATSHEAQRKAAAIWKLRKSFAVTVVLCERADGSTVSHSGAEF